MHLSISLFFKPFLAFLKPNFELFDVMDYMKKSVVFRDVDIYPSCHMVLLLLAFMKSFLQTNISKVLMYSQEEYMSPAGASCYLSYFMMRKIMIFSTLRGNCSEQLWSIGLNWGYTYSWMISLLGI